MTDQPNVAASEAAPVVSAPNLDGDSFTAEQAFEAYQKRNSPEAAAEAPAGTESAVEADAGPEEVPSETKSEDAADNLPPIEAPRSWTKEDKELFNSLPRETQERLAERERSRESDFLRRQNEAAEARKAAEAERTQAGELTRALAAKLPEMEAAVQEYLSHKYPEFKTYDDVVQMARQADALSATDPFAALQLGNRVKAWEVDQQRIAAQLSTARQAADNLAKQKQSDWNKFVQDESKAFADDVPEFKAKEAEYSKRAGEVLRELGFTDEQLTKLVAGEDKIPLFDRRMQRLLFNHIRLSEIKAASTKAIPKPVPAVQKPGVARAPGAAGADAIQATRQKLNSTGSPEDAYALYQAKKARAR